MLLGFAPAARAVPVTITDPYAGQNATGSGAARQASDVIGRYADFDVHSITVSLGDLLITANGNQYGVALVSHGFDAGDLYSITGTRSSDTYLAGSGLYWRFNTAVRSIRPRASRPVGGPARGSVACAPVARLTRPLPRRRPLPKFVSAVPKSDSGPGSERPGPRP